MHTQAPLSWWTRKLFAWWHFSLMKYTALLVWCKLRLFILMNYATVLVWCKEGPLSWTIQPFSYDAIWYPFILMNYTTLLVWCKLRPLYLGELCNCFSLMQSKALYLELYKPFSLMQTEALLSWWTMQPC